jgi:diguanylate cyclase (GGDEF)-like protein/PAS domain S-box-containing protein
VAPGGAGDSRAARGEDRTLDSFRTVCPPLLIAIPQHLALLRDLSRSVATGEAAASLDSSYWDWVRSGAAGQAEALRDPELAQAWDQLGRLHGELLVVAESCLAAVRRGDGATAQRCLEQVFGFSGSVVQLVVGGSLQELSERFGARERELAERYEREFLEAAQIGRFRVRLADHALVSVDESFAQLFGLRPEQLTGLDARQILDRAAVRELVDATAGGRSARVLVRTNGPQPLSLELVAYQEADADPGLLHGFAVNATAADRDAQQRRLLSAAIDSSDQAVVITNARLEIVYVNPAFTRLTGYSREEAMGRNPRFLQGAETSQATRVALREAVASGRQASAEILNYTRAGHGYWVELSIVPVFDERRQVTHWISIERDISDRKAQEREITRMAMEDHLTGLLNRRAAESRLEMEWNRARRDGIAFAAAIADIDRFKLVNDQYGHHVGDDVLVHVSRTLASNLRGGDWIARWGGEEFIIVMHGLDRAGALRAGERTRKLVRSKPVKVAGGELPVTVSIGIALYGPASSGIDALLAQADALLYEAKQTGRDKVLVSGSTRGQRGGILPEGSQVQSALHEGRVLAAYQPIVDLATGQVVGEEALARIRGRDAKLVRAQGFIQAAEALNLVAAVDRAVTSEALDRMAARLERGEPPQACFINLAAQSLADRELVERLREQAQALRIIPGHHNPMVVEITERQTASMDALRAHLDPLVEAGFRLALDDFGSGYSTFRYLAELPVDFLKIEGWMVRNLAGSPRARQLVQTIVATARSLDIRTVAECVEDAQAAQVLCDVGVDWAQGWWFARAALADGEVAD